LSRYGASITKKFVGTYGEKFQVTPYRSASRVPISQGYRHGSAMPSVEETSLDVGAMRRQGGFTLIEVLVAIGISSVLMTLAVFALRTYWVNRSLHDSAEQVISELRQIQEQSVAESHPLVFGTWFKANTSTWGVVRYDPKEPAVSGDDECLQVEGPFEFPTSVVVQAVDFESSSPQTTVCASAVPSGSEIAFFFARGTATPGDITLRQPITDRTESLEVSGLTGRVDRQ
jgi:prepilin-type N-terminal cleavage/methylation domain-containing protein